MERFGISQEMLMLWGGKILFAVLIFAIGLFVGRMLVALVVRLLRRTVGDEALLHFVRSVLNILVLLAVIAAALDQLGVDTTSLVAVLGAAGLAVGLAMKD